MSFQRRQLLQMLSYAVGASFILPQNELAMAAQNAAQPASPAPPVKTAAKHEPGGTEMEKVVGIGGLFFRAHDPKALETVPATLGDPAHTNERGRTRLAARGRTDRLQSLSRKDKVRALDKMVAQLRAAGIEVKDPESYPNIGRFARLHDPEGNPIELWQPA
jgi:glyoxylase I family protein